MFKQTQTVLALDVGGRPYDWLYWQDVVNLYARNEIAWEAGNTVMTAHGGINHKTGQRSVIEINSIVSVKGANMAYKKNQVPALTNRALFARDGHLCMYCGNEFSASVLSRDHVIPRFQGGQDLWDNVVTACKDCNNRKDRYTPEQAGMPLLAIPYVPNHAEYLMLANKRILADQMAFLKLHVPRSRSRAGARR